MKINGCLIRRAPFLVWPSYNVKSSCPVLPTRQPRTAHDASLCLVVRCRRSLSPLSRPARQPPLALAPIIKPQARIPHRSAVHRACHGREQHQGAHRRPQPRGGPRARARHEAVLQLRGRHREEEAAAASAQPAPARVPAPADGQQPAHTQQCSNKRTTARQPARGRRQPAIVASSTPAAAPAHQHDQQQHPATDAHAPTASAL